MCKCVYYMQHWEGVSVHDWQVDLYIVQIRLPGCDKLWFEILFYFLIILKSQIFNTYRQVVFLL